MCSFSLSSFESMLWYPTISTRTCFFSIKWRTVKFLFNYGPWETEIGVQSLYNGCHPHILARVRSSQKSANVASTARKPKVTCQQYIHGVIHRDIQKWKTSIACSSEADQAGRCSAEVHGACRIRLQSGARKNGEATMGTSGSMCWISMQRQCREWESEREREAHCIDAMPSQMITSQSEREIERERSIATRGGCTFGFYPNIEFAPFRGWSPVAGQSVDSLWNRHWRRSFRRLWLFLATSLHLSVCLSVSPSVRQSVCWWVYSSRDGDENNDWSLVSLPLRLKCAHVHSRIMKALFRKAVNT